MPSKKPTQEKIKKVRTKFQTIESKVLESDKQRYFRLPYDAALEAINANLSKTAYRLWIYLSANYPFSDCEVDLPSQTELGIRLQVSRQAINIAAAELQATGLLPKWVIFRKADCVDTERQVRDRLKAELGGETEVVTAVGRIDLLTETELIEIKNINEWKQALGQILAYSAFFPEHSKHIHLFGQFDAAKLALATQTCLEFGITLTFEEVQP